MNNLIRSFCSANTCSIRARIFDFALLARRIVSDIARPFGFLRTDEAIFVQERLVGRRSVGGIGPHPARRIALVEQALAQTISRICGRPSADEAETAIDREWDGPAVLLPYQVGLQSTRSMLPCRKRQTLSPSKLLASIRVRTHS